LQVNGTNSTNTLQSQINTSLGGYYKNEKLKFRASVHSLLFNNLIYSSGLYPNYQNWDKAISIQQIQLEKGFEKKKWYFRNKVLVQLSPSETPINIPLVATYHRIGYDDYLFKSKLQVSVGMDIYFNSPYFNDVYQPIFQSFNPQQKERLQMVPRLNPFFNFKVKRFRASLNFDQVQHFFVKNNLNYVGYAAQNQTFRFGLRWIFIN